MLGISWLALSALRVLRAGLALVTLLRISMLHGKLLCHMTLLLLLLQLLLLGHLLLLGSVQLHLLLHQMCWQLYLSIVLHLLLLQLLHLRRGQLGALLHALHLCLLLCQHLLMA